MVKFEPVGIRKNAFAFCKWIVAILVWISLFYQTYVLITFVTFFFLFSVITGVKYSIFVYLYENTVERIFPSSEIIVDKKALKFAHTIGGIVALIALTFLFVGNTLAATCVILFLAIMKTLGAVGFCGATSLYSCAMNSNGSCCRFLRSKK